MIVGVVKRRFPILITAKRATLKATARGLTKKKRPRKKSAVKPKKTVPMKITGKTKKLKRANTKKSHPKERSERVNKVKRVASLVVTLRLVRFIQKE